MYLDARRHRPPKLCRKSVKIGLVLSMSALLLLQIFTVVTAEGKSIN